MPLVERVFHSPLETKDAFEGIAVGAICMYIEEEKRLVVYACFVLPRLISYRLARGKTQARRRQVFLTPFRRIEEVLIQTGRDITTKPEGISASRESPFSISPLWRRPQAPLKSHKHG